MENIEKNVQVFTYEEMGKLRKKVLDEEAQNNKEEFFISIAKLNSLTNPFEKLPYEINKVQILEYLKDRLVEMKAMQMAIKITAGIEYDDPMRTIKEIEIYELLLEYLENDKTLDQNNGNKTLKLRLKSVE